jgi:hypothetical protein
LRVASYCSGHVAHAVLAFHMPLQVQLQPLKMLPTTPVACPLQFAAEVQVR